MKLKEAKILAKNKEDFDKSKLLQVLKKGDEFNGKTIKNVYIRRLFEDDIEIYLELRNGL